MTIESRPPARESEGSKPNNGVEAEGFAQNQQELEEIRRALAREAGEYVQSHVPAEDIHEQEPVRARIERPLLRELVRRTIKELTHDKTLPTEQDVEADFSHRLNRPLRPQERIVIRELLKDTQHTGQTEASPQNTQHTQHAPQERVSVRKDIPPEKQGDLDRRYRELLFNAVDPKLVRALSLCYKAGREMDDTTFRSILQGRGRADIEDLALAFQAGGAISGNYRTAEQQYVTNLMQSVGAATRQLMEAHKAGRAADYSTLETLLQKAEDPYRIYVAFQAGEESKGGIPDVGRHTVETTGSPARESIETPEATSRSILAEFFGGGTGQPDLDQKLLEIAKGVEPNQSEAFRSAFAAGIYGDAFDVLGKDAKMRQTYAIGLEANRRNKTRQQNRDTTEQGKEKGVSAKFQLQPPQLQPLWDRAPDKENPYAKTALHNAYDDGYAGDVSRSKSYIWSNSSILTDTEKRLADEAFRIGYAEWEAAHPEEAAERRRQQAARGVTESAEEPAPRQNAERQTPQPETLTPYERLMRLQAESPDIHPDTLDRAFRRGRARMQNSMRDFFKEHGERFDAVQKAKIIEAYNIGAEMYGHPPFTYEPPPATSEEQHEPMPDQTHEEAPRGPKPEPAATDEEQKEYGAPDKPEGETAEELLDRKSYEVLSINLEATREAYAKADFNTKSNAIDQEWVVAHSNYRVAINAIRDYYQRHITTDTLLSPEQKAQKIQEIILETTAREANRLFNLKTEIKIKGREEAADQRIANAGTKSPLGEALFAHAEFARAGGRMALRAAEAYHNLPIKYKLALSGVLAGGSIAAGALALPTIAIGLGLGVSAQRILGGGAAAISMETWRRGKQEKKSEKEVAQEIERQGDLLTTLLRADNQERLNDLMLKQAGRKGWERNRRMALAGLTFAAIATGLPGKSIRYVAQSETAHTVMNALGTTDELKDRVWTGADGVKKSIKGFFVQEGVAHAAEPQSAGATAQTPAASEGWGTKIKRGLLSVVGADNPEELSRPQPAGSDSAIAENESPPQQNQPAQSGGKEQWNPATNQWEPVGKTVPASTVPQPQEGTGRNPYATPAETPPKTAAVTEAPAEAGAPKNARGVAERARAKDAMERATVRKGEGAWQAVRRQFYERMRAEPQKFGMSPEDAGKLPEDISKLGKGTQAAKLLNRETLATLKKAGYINPDGTTKLGITKPGIRVFLTPDNKIELQGEGKLTYEPTGQRPKAGTAPERTGHARGSTAAEQTGRARRGGVSPQERGTFRQYIGLNQEPLQNLEPRGGVAGEQTPEANLKSNLKQFGLKPQEFKNISEMKSKAFIDEMGRHDTEIREHIRSGARDTTGIFINRGPFTARGFSADMAEAKKYLDMSERLEKYLKPLGRTARRVILDKPMGDILRALSFEK